MLVVLGVLLFGTVAGANAVVGAERTVLNAEFVAEGINGTGFYESQAEAVTEQVAPDGAGSDIAAGLEGPGPPVEEFADSVVTTEYVRSEFEGMLSSLFAYLHGDTDELALAIDTRPLKSGFAAEFETWIVELDADRIDPRMGDLTESESQFERTRTEFKERWLQRIQQETDEEYTRAELEAIYDDRRGQVRRATIDRLESQVAESGGPPELRTAMVEYGTVGVDALVAADADYETFLEDEAAARQQLAADVRDVVRAGLDEQIPDEQDFAEGMDEEARNTLEDARGYVSLLDTLALLLPLAALVFAALLGYVSRRRSNGLWRVGGIVAVIGFAVGLAATIVPGMLPDLLDVDPAGTGTGPEIVLGLLSDALGTIALQSWLLFVLGLALVAAGIAVRRDLLPIEDDPEGA